MRVQKRLLTAAFGLLVLSSACAARQPGQAPKPGFNMFSKEQDIQLGREAAAQVRQQYPAVQNQFLQEYVSRVGQRLASQPEAGGYPYSFTLLNDPSVNAFSLPGGPSFVFAGLLSACENEAQLAGVLAHEISHVALRHATNQVSKANLLQIPAALAGAAAGSGSLTGQLAQLGIGLGFNSLLLKFSRTDESQADALGARIMARAGYNPIEMARFFEKLQAQGGSRAPEFLSDHPNPGNRERAIEAEIRALPAGSYGYSTGQFNEAKSMVAGLPAAPRNTKRATRSELRPPSGGWQQMQGRDFTVNYPGNWQVFGDNNSSMVTIAPQEGLANDGGRTQIGYGAVLSYYIPQNGRVNLRNDTNELLRRLQAENPSMRVAGNQRRVRVNGSDGLITTIESASPFGGGETDAVLTVARPEGLFYMVLIAPQSRFGDLQDTFSQMINSLRFNR